MNYVDMKKILFAVILLLGSILSTTAQNNTSMTTEDIPVTYVSYVDNNYGFYRVIDITTAKQSPYKNRTLSINQGDNVVWVNDGEVTITIVSKQGLWDNTKSKLKLPIKRFNYTFMNPGNYDIYIDEYRAIPHQIIAVAPKKGYIIPTPTPVVTVPTPTRVPTPVPTPTPIVTMPTPTPVTPVETGDNWIIGNSNPNVANPTIDSKLDISSTMIMSIIVALLAIIITYKTGK